MPEHLNNTPQRADQAAPPNISARTQLLRAAADGELAPSQVAELERHLAGQPADQRVIELERGLRKALAASAAGDAPVELRERVAAMTSSARAGEGMVQSNFGFPSGVARRRTRYSRTVRWMAMAASVAIVAGGGFVWVYRSVEPSNVTGITQHYRTSLVSFIGAQHKECEVHADMIGTRFKTTKLAEVPTEFAQVLGTAPDIGHIDSPDFKLLGAGPCAVPGRGKSVRMVLECNAEKGTAGGRGSLVSIHIQQDTGELNLESGKTYRLTDRDSTGYDTSEIFVWRRDGFVYFLTSRSEQAMQMARAALGAKEPSGTL